MRKIRLLILGMLLPILAAATTFSEYLVVPITLDDGLSQASARSVLRDNKGYLWVGTTWGLNRYDNHTVTSYFVDDFDSWEIPDNEVTVITLDGSGTLLIGFAGGLAKYDYANDIFQPVRLPNGVNVTVRSARQVDGGTLFGGTGKLFFYESETGRLSLLPASGAPSAAFVNITAQWRPGCYILSSYFDGLWLYNSASSTVTPVDFCKEKRIRGTFVDKEGNLWVSPFGKGLWKYDPQGNRVAVLNTRNSALSNDIVLDITEFEGEIWAATEVGVSVVNKETLEVRRLGILAPGPKNCAVVCLSPDNDNSIYAGTLRHGVMCIYKVPMRTFTHYGIEYSRFGFTVPAIYRDPGTGRVWIGVDGEGVAEFNPKTEIINPYPSTANLKVTSIMGYDDNNLLFSAYNAGLYLLDLNSGAVKPVPQTLTKAHTLAMDNVVATELLRLADGRIAVITDDVHTVNPTTGEMKKARFNGIRARAANLTPFHSDGNTVHLWDLHNLYRYDSATDTIGVIFSVNQDDVISCAALESDHTFWVATNNGLRHYNSATGETGLRHIDYLRNITSLAVEGDRLWVAADTKMYLVNGDAVTVFDKSDGVSPNQFINKSQLITDDYMLLGGVNGLLKINRGDIDRLIAEPSHANLSLSELLVDNTRVTVGDNGTAEVSKSHSTVTVKIIDHDSSGLRNKLFRYSIKGFSRDLTFETFDRFFNLNMLPPGTYEVSVAYCLNDGKWSEPVDLVKIKVKVPWWRSWWAIMIYILVLAVCSVLLYITLRIRRRRRLDEIHRNALEEKVGFLSRIHSDLRTPLTLILSPLNALLERLRERGSADDAETIDSLEDIYSSSLQMRDLIDTLPERSDLASYIKSAREIMGDIPGAASAQADNMVDNFDLGPYTAYVVEGNEKLCSYLMGELDGVFNTVGFASNAKDAMRGIKEMKPDIVVVDVSLDDAEGFDLCRDLKSSESLRHIPVILLTSGNDERERRKSNATGADSNISKPFDIEVLISRCKNLLLNRSNMRNRYNNTTPADAMTAMPVSNSDETFIIEVDRLLSENISHPDFGVDFLAKKMLLSRTAFYARMRQVTGKSIGQYISDFRLEQAKQMLSTGTKSISDIAEALGFRSQRYFSTFFKEKTGVAPTEYRKNV